MALAEKTVEALQSTLLEKLIDVPLDGSLAIELALLGELNRGFDVLRHFLKHEQGLLVSPLINVVQADEVPDLCRAQALAELVLKRTERVKSVLLKVEDRSLSLQSLLIETHHVLRAQL